MLWLNAVARYGLMMLVTPIVRQVELTKTFDTPKKRTGQTAERFRSVKTSSPGLRRKVSPGAEAIIPTQSFETELRTRLSSNEKKKRKSD